MSLQPISQNSSFGASSHKSERNAVSRGKRNGRRVSMMPRVTKTKNKANHRQSLSGNMGRSSVGRSSQGRQSMGRQSTGRQSMGRCVNIFLFFFFLVLNMICDYDNNNYYCY